MWATAPIGYRGLAAFLEHRKAPKHREHIRQLLEQYGCDDLEGFLQVTHALSLNDTFWVKKREDILQWRDVSLYTNPFSEVISEAAFDGTISETDFSSISPEFGTDGSYAKCWIREESGIKLYKSGSALLEIEPLPEFLAWQLAEGICRQAVPYDLDHYHGKLISKCPLFTSKTVGLAKASAVFHGAEHTIPDLLQYFRGIGSEDAFRRMCVLDAIILNPDRHYGNFGVLFDTATITPGLRTTGTYLWSSFFLYDRGRRLPLKEPAGAGLDTYCCLCFSPHATQDVLLNRQFGDAPHAPVPVAL